MGSICMGSLLRLLYQLVLQNNFFNAVRCSVYEFNKIEFLMLWWIQLQAMIFFFHDKISEKNFCNLVKFIGFLWFKFSC